MANSGPRSNTSQFFFTFRATEHLNGKHTVFGKLVGGEEVLTQIERIPIRRGTDRPTKDVIITGVQVLQDPFEAYQARLTARLARQDQSDESLRKRAEAQAAREKDRTTWLGTDLGAKGESRGVKEERKRKADEEGILVGKYLGAGKKVGLPGGGSEAELEFGGEKKKKKAGGFGDFSGW